MDLSSTEGFNINDSIAKEYSIVVIVPPLTGQLNGSPNLDGMLF